MFDTIHFNLREVTEQTMAVASVTEDRLTCGCVVLKYASGKNYQSGCIVHRSKYQYSCPTCGAKFRVSKMLIEHRWLHAY